MGTNIFVSLPPVGNSKTCGSFGDIRLSRSMWKDCTNVGIPLDSIEDGIFCWDPSGEELERILLATKVQIRSLHEQLDTGEDGWQPRKDCPWGTSNYDVANYLQEWVDLMEATHEMRIRGVAASFFGC